LVKICDRGDTTETLQNITNDDMLLEVQGLSVSFKTERGILPAVDDVSFKVKKGEMTGIVGESGCGKSVTALSILRLLPAPAARIAGGCIRFRGEDLLRLPEEKMRLLRGRAISMVFQDPMTSLNPVFRVGYQVGEILRTHFPDMNRKAISEKVRELFDMLGIPSPQRRMRSYPHELSGGLRQRVMIAMALACNPELMIADEPTTALDVTIQAQILDLIRDLQGKLGMSVLFITHDLGIVAQNTQRVVVMYAGKVVEEAETKELFRDPRHPYTRGLLRSLPGQQGNIQGKTKLPSIPGMVPDPLALPAGCYFRDRCPDAFDRCENAMPPLSLCGDPQHLVRCWLYTEETS